MYATMTKVAVFIYLACNINNNITWIGCWINLIEILLLACLDQLLEFDWNSIICMYYY
jgi:hypothetical protein